MPRRQLKFDKLRFGISFALAVVSYNILDWVFNFSYDISIWKWLKSQVFVNQSALTVLFSWIMLFFIPILIWYKVVGLFMNRQNQT